MMDFQRAICLAGKEPGFAPVRTSYADAVVGYYPSPFRGAIWRTEPYMVRTPRGRAWRDRWGNWEIISNA